MSLKMLTDRRFWTHVPWLDMSFPVLVFNACLPWLLYLIADSWLNMVTVIVLHCQWPVLEFIGLSCITVVSVFIANHSLGMLLCELTKAAWMADDKKYFLDGIHFLEDDDSLSITEVHWTDADALSGMIIHRVTYGCYFPKRVVDFGIGCDYILIDRIDEADVPEWVWRKRRMYLMAKRLEAL